MNRKLITTSVLLLTAAFVYAQNYITLHEDCNYGGKSYFLEAGTYKMYQMRIGNDRLSCIQIPYGFKVTIYENDDFYGKSKTYTGNVPCLETEWNDMASSIVVENSNYQQGNPSDYVVFYTDCYSKGIYRSLRPGTYKGADLGEFKNNISSFYIYGNLRVRVYTNNESATGYYNTFESSQSCLSNNYNDKISSLVIEYKPNTSSGNNSGNIGGIGNFATFYSECNYGGNAIRLQPGYYSSEKLGVLKYAIESAQVPANLQVKVFINNDNLYGDSKILTGNTNCMDYSLKDKIGSMVIETKSGSSGGNNSNLPTYDAVVIYTDANYKGQSSYLLPGSYFTMSQAGGFPAKALSSLHVPPGFKVVIYEEENFGGKSMTITDSRSGFSFSNWNDRAASIKVYRD
ncbi:MAG TPA: beta/gamma crystallin-related protein [Chitinophagaceae bacterium]|jgi:hypothetical protein|nr:beta/gamma crystallin-related protein [Chitinophagaceae bacterium]HMU58255.1 beta/gamma crystallin-related protein [Chitinophagaceae bacterium]